MKRMLSLLLSLSLLAALVTGCKAPPEEAPWPETVTASNLTDEASRALASQLLELSSTPAQAEVFWAHVDQINGFFEPGELTEGFEELTIAQPRYDPYAVQERWEAVYPEFLGYNCRITAFSLLQDRLEADPRPDAASDYVMMDLISLDMDPAAIPDGEAFSRFIALYEGIETENTKDISVHLRHLQEAWTDRGVAFEEGPVSLISVLFHDQLDGDRLFVGHTGLLYELGDELYFLEKIAFQEPYQLVRLDSRAQLSDYLMAKYDVEFGQPTAAPFVVENDQLIEGYRAHSEGQ